MSINKNPAKKKFVPPKLKAHGPISKISQSASQGGAGDPSPPPFDRKGTMMCLTPPPSIEEHRLLLSDHTSQNAFAREIANCIRPGDVVLDLGTGSGIHAFLAVRAGASHVYAVDSDSVLQFARAAAERNAISDKITFLDSDFRKIEIPTEVDVIISNVGFLQSINDVPAIAAKHLAPGGRMIPDAVQISFAPVSCENFYKSHVDVWKTSQLGFDFASLRDMAVNHPQYLHYNGNEFLSDYWSSSVIGLKKEISEKMSWEVITPILQDSVCHGIGGWYSFISNNRVFMSTQPPLHLNPQIWSHFILPLQEPLSLKRGDIVKSHITLLREGAQGFPVWSWEVQKNQESAQTQSSFQLLKDNFS